MYVDVERVSVTEHALQRYRERFDPRATRDSVVHALRDAERAPAWMYKCVGEYLAPDTALLLRGHTLFVVRPSKGQLNFSLVTVLSRSLADSNRTRYGTKLHKGGAHGRNRRFS
jgi:hypothetical protein